MADTKITALAAITTVAPANDLFAIVDVSDNSMAASGTTKNITTNQILGAGGTATLASATITGAATVGTTLGVTGVSTFAAGTALLPALTTTGDTNTGIYYPAADTFAVTTGGTERYRVDSAGNCGIGVTPSAWAAAVKALQIGAAGAASYDGTNYDISSNRYLASGGTSTYIANGFATMARQVSGQHLWYNAPSGTAGNAITFTQAMTLDSGGNLLVGLTSGTYNRIKKDSAADAGNAIFELVGASNATSSIHYSVSSYNANDANAASKFGRDATTLRSINAGGTVNASGADYAEYMIKCGDFTLSKGGIAGIDSNGKLTNVFADAVSFVVKSTDPSYVGNDKWGVDLKGDALEAARQLVDRIAFAGQVPVNVTGAKAGDYIVPVVDGTEIKGIAVTSPTFEQYQIAVGKVIAIDTDGRARIIVKVA